MATTKEVTRTELLNKCVSEITALKTESPQKDIVQLAQSYIAESITTKQQNAHRGIIRDIYKELAETYTEQATKLNGLAKENDPYLITNLSNFDSFLKSYNESNNYNCRLFPKSDYEKHLVFAPATIGFIGARTSRGKTTALVSVAMDALEQNKRVFFTTMEESQHQIFLRFILHILYKGGYFPENPSANATLNPATWNNALLNTKFNSKRTVLKILRNEPIGDIFPDSNITKKFTQNVLQAKETLNNYLKSGKLAIYNGMESPSFEYMIDAMTDNDAGTICLLDYIQKVKQPSKFFGSENRFPMLQYVSNEIANATKRTNIITISGAQFGRTNEKQKSTVLDLFTDESFQECSAIEQAGEIEIGIGRHFNKGVKHSYYAILKDRDNGEYNPSIYYELEGVEKFSMFAPKRREVEKDGNKYNNLIEYYNQDTDTIDGETKAERNKRIYGSKPKGKQNEDNDDDNNPANTIQAGKATLTQGGWDK